MTEIRVQVDIDAVTLGDFADVQRGRIMPLIGKSVQIQGVKDIGKVKMSDYFGPVIKAVRAKLDEIASGEIVSPVALDDILISGLDEMLFEDYGQIEQGFVAAFRKFVSVRGYDDFDNVPFKAIGLIKEKLAHEINQATDPND